MKLHAIHGRNQYCGPAVIAGLTGLSTDESARLIRAATGRAQIKSTTPLEVIDTLRSLSFWVERYKIYPRDASAPLLEVWLEEHSSPWTGTWLIATSKHWQIVSGGCFGVLQEQGAKQVA